MIDMMSIKSIHNETDYDIVLNRVDKLMDLTPALGTPKSDELEALALLIVKYEEKIWAIQS